jgi:molybdenum cofactor cytidylyltransferase
MGKFDNISILILAAGSSKRLKEPKQLLRFNDDSLLRRAIKKSLELTENIYVVLGHRSELCQEDISDLKVKILYNDNYKKGMGSSISFGISNIQNSSNVLIMLCDQPLIPIDHYLNMIKKFNENNTIVCSKYNKQYAVPSIFPRSSFSSLLQLSGDKGAKSILNESEVEFILLKDEYAIDIDTPDDYKKLCKII